MPTVTYRFNDTKKIIEKVTQPDTPDPIVEEVDPLGFDVQIQQLTDLNQNLTEQVGGFGQAKEQAQAEADARKADMDSKTTDINSQISANNDKIAALQAQKGAIYAQFPDLNKVIDNVNQAVQQTAAPAEAPAQPAS